MASTRNDDSKASKAARAKKVKANTKLAKKLPLEEMFAVFNKEKSYAMEVINKTYPKNRYTVTELGGGNNTNILVQKNDNSASMVIQLSRFKDSAENFIQQYNNENRPNWLAEEYAHATKVEPNQRKYTPHDFESITCMEQCYGSLSKKTEADHRAGRYDQTIKFAANIGIQISALLNDLSEKNIIWMDLKAGNVLLRGNGQIVVSDWKGFCPVDLLLQKMEDGKVIIDYFEMANITEQFLSRDFLDNKLGFMSPGMDTKRIWEKEYSYQLSVIMYNIASNQDKENVLAVRYKPDQEQPAISKFNFDHPCFKNEEGKRLEFIIKSLSHDNPDLRMDHRYAAKLLNVMENKLEFNKLKVAFVENKSLKEAKLNAKMESDAMLKSEAPTATASSVSEAVKPASETSTNPIQDAPKAENVSTPDKKQSKASTSMLLRGLSSGGLKKLLSQEKPKLEQTSSTKGNLKDRGNEKEATALTDKKELEKSPAKEPLVEEESKDLESTSSVRFGPGIK